MLQCEKEEASGEKREEASGEKREETIAEYAREMETEEYWFLTGKFTRKFVPVQSANMQAKLVEMLRTSFKFLREMAIQME